MLESANSFFLIPLSELNVYDVIIMVLFILALILTIIFSLILISAKLRRIDSDIKDNSNNHISNDKAILSYLEAIADRLSIKLNPYVVTNANIRSDYNANEQENKEFDLDNLEYKDPDQVEDVHPIPQLPHLSLNLLEQQDNQDEAPQRPMLTQQETLSQNRPAFQTPNNMPVKPSFAFGAPKQGLFGNQQQNRLQQAARPTLGANRPTPSRPTPSRPTLGGLNSSTKKTTITRTSTTNTRPILGGANKAQARPTLGANRANPTARPTAQGRTSPQTIRGTARPAPALARGNAKPSLVSTSRSATRTSPNATNRPVARPNVTTRPAARPNATTRPTATNRPVARPAATNRPAARPAATSRPVARPALAARGTTGRGNTSRPTPRR